ncbi:hypothetical protein VMCG_08992 [Cytospora schulzeri]|uniref:Apple domain-containing protein n=1 Tax=Cytospora schulzeri TaxID=448051 RepID=A0A423VPM3_9PEZI|nr:hypothetical protein VMCG_08992 [Valsa malicola]
MKFLTSILSLPSLLFAKTTLSEITCGVRSGYDRGVNAYFYSGDGSLAEFDVCSARCQSDTKCQSFAFGDSQCLLYSEPLEDNFRQQSGSPFLFYDRNCVDVEPTSSFTTILPPTTSSSVASTTAHSDVTSSHPAATTSEASDEAGASEPNSVPSVESEGPTVPTTTADPINGHPGASETYSSLATLATVTASASDSSSSGTSDTGSSDSGPSNSGSSNLGTSYSSEVSPTGAAESTSTSSGGASLQASDSESMATGFMHDSWWPTILGSHCLIAMFM